MIFDIELNFLPTSCMPRTFRVEYPGAIYHLPRNGAINQEHPVLTRERGISHGPRLCDDMNTRGTTWCRRNWSVSNSNGSEMKLHTHDEIEGLAQIQLSASIRNVLVELAEVLKLPSRKQRGV